MTTYHRQFLYFVDAYGRPTEIINGARTAQALEDASALTSAFSAVMDDGDCPALRYQPCTMLSNGQMTTWDPLPASAPWFIPDVSGDAYTFDPEDSRDALGFYITEWTGLDGAHHVRSSTPLGRRGAKYGKQSHKDRVMKLNVMLIGLTERSLDYLFRWLESTLLGCCSSCSSDDIWIRETCPGSTATDADLERGLVRLRDVALLEGPTWEAPPVAGAGCNLRLASFTIAAGDPCLYAVPGSTTSTTMLGSLASGLGDPFTQATPQTWLGTVNQICATLDFPEVGLAAPVVTITSPLEVGTSTAARRPLPDLRIAGYSQPSGSDCDVANAILLGELILSGEGSSGLEIEVDLAARRVLVRDNYASTGWEDGSWLIRTSTDGNRRWWTIGACDRARVVIEPVYKALDTTAETLIGGGDGLLSQWTVSVAAQHYRGCC